MISGNRLVLVFVRKCGLAHAMGIIGAFFSPGRERGAEAMHGHVPVT